jgi:hypothetical protein
MVIKNSKGQPIVLNEREQRVADVNQRLCNALGYEVPITTLTTIIKKVSEQKFFRIPFAKYLPVVVGEGAWGSNLTKFRSFEIADDFATGVINTGGNNGRLASGDAGVDSVNVIISNWGKSVGWSLFDVQLAAKSGNWDLITAKEKSRKSNWDLGLQKIAFLGLAGDSATLGLFNQPGVTMDTTTITQSITSMAATPSVLSAFLATVLNQYRTNCGRTAMPSHFIIPESDYLGLATPSSPTFPLKSVMALMLETFQVMTGNPNFQILPCAYADKAYSGLSTQMYTLLNYDEDSIAMNIPVDYTNTIANSIDNFSFQNAAYGQFSGVVTYRQSELYYMGF